jgi:DNA-binding GntR family transcriptional regulator
VRQADQFLDDDLPDASVPERDSSMSASVHAADVLRERILGGEFPSGSALREKTLAISLGISRNTLREALRQLLSEGLIEQELYRGATVRKMSHQDVRDVFAARRTLQFRAVELSAYAAQHCFDDLDRWVSRGEEAAKRDDWLEVGTASLHFHLAIVAMIGSPLLNRFFQVVMTQLSLALEGRRAERDFQSQWVPRNREICTLLCAGNRQDAMRALASFISDSERIVLDIVRAGSSSVVPAGAARRGKPGPKPASEASGNSRTPTGQTGGSA